MNHSDYIFRQVAHWLNTPTNGYLGSNYGIDLPAELQKPINSFDADGIIAKMLEDVPILSFIDREQINIYAEKVDVDHINIMLQVGDITINLTNFSTDYSE